MTSSLVQRGGVIPDFAVADQSASCLHTSAPEGMESLRLSSEAG